MFPNLHAEQARRGLTDAQVAEMLGISRSAYGLKKRTGRFVTSECHSLCKIFESEFPYLFSFQPMRALGNDSTRTASVQDSSTATHTSM